LMRSKVDHAGLDQSLGDGGGTAIPVFEERPFGLA